MSKSRGNVIEPPRRSSPSTARTRCAPTMLFAGPIEEDVDWEDVSTEGMARWIQRVWRTVHAAVAEPPAG